MKGLFFDIDGTLAIRRHIPAENRKALQQLKEEGKSTWICTGRAPFYAQSMFADLTTGIICCNGRCILQDGKVLFQNFLSPEEKEQILALAQSCHLGLLWVGLDTVWCMDCSQEQIEGTIREYGKDHVQTAGIEDLPNLPVMTFDLYYSSLQDFKKAQEVFENLAVLNDHGGHGSADCSTIWFDKGSAIAWLQDALPVQPADCYAFGDGDNDKAMFRVCENRIAMENGTPALKAAASYITGAVDAGGIVWALAHFGLLEKA